MGTAAQSISNPTQHDEFVDTVKEALGRSPRRTEQLNMKLREVINDVLFNDPALAAVRPTLKNAIDRKVTAEITNKLKTWIASGKKLSDWPFKNVEIDD